ncbi:hypothetical protein AX17_003176 [Amanita inopinata Kibby_2008]|nr:hypothetical protein AX17_003176 [Amanita inopinata Kibby_2008]
MKPQSDVFRPKLPLDPFVDLDVDQPWLIQPDANESLLSNVPRVVLVLGAPAQADIEPLLSSHSLSTSLVLMATHNPPPLSGQVQPTVRILRLPSNADVQDSGALHLVGVLERAERVANRWRRHKSSLGDQKILQLAEGTPGGDFTVAEEYRTPRVGEADAAAYPSPAPSFSSISNARSMFKRRQNQSSHSPTSSARSLPQSPFHAKDKFLLGQRPFDAILNFLPSSLLEKDILKHAILVTTLSVSFLTCTIPHPIPASQSSSINSSKRRLSSLLRSRPIQNEVAVAPQTSPGTAHLVHILSSVGPTTPSFAASLTSLQFSSSLHSSASSVSASPAQSCRSSYLRLPRSNSPNSHSLSRSNSRPSSVNSTSSTVTLCISPPHSAASSSIHMHPHRQPSPTTVLESERPLSMQSIDSMTMTGRKPKLAQTIEQFLLSFAYSHPARGMSGVPSRSVPYLLAPGVLNSVVCHRQQEIEQQDMSRSEIESLASEGKLTVGVAIVLGLLDPCAKGEDIGKNMKSVAGLASRAWIGNAQQVVLAPKGSLPVADVMAYVDVAMPAPACSVQGREMEKEAPIVREEPSPLSSPRQTGVEDVWHGVGIPNVPMIHLDEPALPEPAAVVPRIYSNSSLPLVMDAHAPASSVQGREIEKEALIVQEEPPPLPSPMQPGLEDPQDGVSISSAPLIQLDELSLPELASVVPSIRSSSPPPVVTDALAPSVQEREVETEAPIVQEESSPLSSPRQPEVEEVQDGASIFSVPVIQLDEPSLPEPAAVVPSICSSSSLLMVTDALASASSVQEREMEEVLIVREEPSPLSDPRQPEVEDLQDGTSISSVLLIQLDEPAPPEPAAVCSSSPPPMVADPHAGATSEDAWKGRIDGGLPTPPKSTSSLEGTSEVVVCESGMEDTQYAVNDPGSRSRTAIAIEEEANDVFRAETLYQNCSSVDEGDKGSIFGRGEEVLVEEVKAEGAPRTGTLAGRIGHGFKSMTKRVSMSTLSTSVLLRGVRKREQRDTLAPVSVA